MIRRYEAAALVALISLGVGCSDSEAGNGSTGAGETDGGAEEGGDDVGLEPLPDGPGCDEPWEGWWNEEPQELQSPPSHDIAPEGQPQASKLEARASLSSQLASPQPTSSDDFRSTLISEAAVLSSGRNMGVSWCLGAIEPNPRGPGGIINEELDLINRQRYDFFRRELEGATRMWERHSRMNFVHLAGLDDRRIPSGGDCDTALEHVWFRAQTRECNHNLQGSTNANGLNEFDPAFASPDNPEGSERLLCTAWQILEGAPTRVPWLMEHESGHIVGLDHEHVRWDQSDVVVTNCGDNDPFVPVSNDRILTPADAQSAMGYPECNNSQQVNEASPLNMLGAYYTFNWTERRVRDMAPSTGGRDQRYWAGDQRPGVLWYEPFSDRLLEWRFDAQQPGELSFSPIERCLSSGCSLTDPAGHWHPVMGQFTGSSTRLDVFMYAADDSADFLLRNAGSPNFDARIKAAPNRAIPVVGNFGSGIRDQILWYRPGPAPDLMWQFAEDGSHSMVDVDVNQNGWRIPLTGHFRSRTFVTDILWFDPTDATVDTWLFSVDFSVSKSVGGSSVAQLGVVSSVEYVPVIGNFNGDNQTDIFWYSPGPDADWLWHAIGNQEAALFASFEFAVDGEYHPVSGDFDADGDDDILWYRPAGESESGQSWIWYFDGASVDPRPVLIQGDYVPYVEDFDSDGCTDILWYDPVAPDNGSPVWRCIPNERDFECGERLSAPKSAYPIGFATGGY